MGMADADRARLRRCLEVVAGGQVFEDWEFQALFGLDRADVSAVLAKWPHVDKSDARVDLIISNTLTNLLGYPHGLDLTTLVGASRPELEATLERWRAHREGLGTSDLRRPPIARRIAAARAQLGLSHANVADQLGLSVQSYWDLETHDDEAFYCLSLRQLIRLADILGVSVIDLANDDPPVPVSPPVTPTDIVATLRQRLVEPPLSVELLSEQLGWDVAGVLANPDSIWEDWCLDALRDVCGPLGLDWRAVLPAQRALPQN
jgi:transcriptional regulator with XRE-family HTH domain